MHAPAPISCQLARHADAETSKGSFMADSTEQARRTAIGIIARDLRIDLEEAQRWCDAWERFARRGGVPRGRYFWDSGRGWIDAQRSFEKANRSPDGRIDHASVPRCPSRECPRDLQSPPRAESTSCPKGRPCLPPWHRSGSSGLTSCGQPVMVRHVELPQPAEGRLDIGPGRRPVRPRRPRQPFLRADGPLQHRSPHLDREVIHSSWCGPGKPATLHRLDRHAEDGTGALPRDDIGIGEDDLMEIAAGPEAQLDNKSVEVPDAVRLAVATNAQDLSGRTLSGQAQHPVLVAPLDPPAGEPSRSRRRPRHR